MNKKKDCRDFPGSPVVKNPPSSEGDVGSIPGWGTKIPHAAGQLSPTCHNNWACAPQPEREDPCAATREKPAHRNKDLTQPKKKKKGRL